MAIGFINGEFVPIDQLAVPIDERGHQFGDGIYEVIHVYNGKPFMLTEHLERLEKSAEAIRIKLHYSRAELENIISEGIEKSGINGDADVYLQVTRGIAVRQHLFPDTPPSTTMTVRAARPVPAQYREEGVAAIFLADERWANCYIKSLNLLPNVLARQTAHEAGCYEAILIRDGYVTEGTSSNVFVVKNGTVWTTPLTKHILPGITRIAVLRLLSALEIPLEEKHIKPEELKAADEVFITSTTSEIIPIVKVDGEKIGTGAPGKITGRLYEQFQKMCSSL